MRTKLILLHFCLIISHFLVCRREIFLKTMCNLSFNISGTPTTFCLSSQEADIKDSQEIYS